MREWKSGRSLDFCLRNSLVADELLADEKVQTQFVALKNLQITPVRVNDQQIQRFR